MPHVPGKSQGGRPTKKNAQAIARILSIARTGLPLKFAAQAANIDPDTLGQWCVKDPEFDRALSQARLEAVEERWQLIKRAAEGYKENPPDWRAVAWQLERTNLDFARPEVALNLAMQNNTVNQLTINITGQEYAAIESEAEPIRTKVQAMLAKYRPSTGNGDSGVHNIEATTVPEVVKEPSPITHRDDSDAQNPNFWRKLVTSPPECKVAKGTALFAVRTLLLQTLGFKGHRIEVNFDDDPIPLEDMFSRLEQLGGPACWATAQKLGGFTQ
jgi:hypothetical protein